MVYHPDHNIGVAMDTPKGLVVPVLKRVQEKSLFQVRPSVRPFACVGRLTAARPAVLLFRGDTTGR